MSKINICEKGSFYICFRCLKFKCNSKNDMKRHYERTTLCEANIIINDENQDNNYFYNKSTSHRFVTEMNIKYLDDIHIKIIIDNFNKQYNLITFELLNSYINDENIKVIKNNDNINTYYIKLTNKDDEIEKNKEYKCTNCFSEFSSIYILNEHIKNIDYCNKKKELNILKSENKSLINISSDDLIKKYIEENKNKKIENNFNTINNFQTQNNIQNNNQNNSQNSNFYLNTNDFLNENYDYSHLNIENLNDKFFEYSNFLENLLKNEANQNLYFTNNGYGIYYADNTLNKSQSEMIVCFIITKLKSTLESILQNLDEAKQNQKRHLKKYYNKLDGQYKNNCYYQKYNFDDKQFYNTCIKHRIRDKFIKETYRIYNIYFDETKNKFMNSELYKEKNCCK